MHSADGRYTLVYNGEIYNHLELRQRLPSSIQYRSTSDTETLLWAYAHFGTAVFAELNGIFAFAIYDRKQHEVVLCRDHFGVKPLYYYQKDQEFYFASELKALLAIPALDKRLDYSALMQYIHYLWSPGERTPLQYVRKLQPGYFAVIPVNQPSKWKLERYYNIPLAGERIEESETAWIKRLDTQLTTAVERQLLADVPVGFFLSGGLDSSLIVAKAREILGRKLPCYTVDTGWGDSKTDGFQDDLVYAKRVAKYLDVDLEIVGGEVSIMDSFDQMIWHLDEPQADAAPLHVLRICQHARSQGHVVLLGGAGGDDLFSGYRRHQALSLERYLQLIPKSIGRAAQKLTRNLPANNPLARRLQKLLKHIDRSPAERMAGYFEWLPLTRNRLLFHPDIQQELGNYDPTNILLNSLADIPKEHSTLNQMLYWEMRYFLPDHNLNYTDKLSMATGVETRVPYLDPDLVAMSAQMPINLKMKGKQTKYLLKKVAENYLPADVIYRPKTGFGAPVRKWIAEDLQPMLTERLSPNRIKDRGLFDPKAVEQLLNDHHQGRIDAAYSIWSLLAIESWMEQFIDT